MPSLRTLLVLGRTSNLPTVWSNCLAAWWLGGGVQLGALAGVLLGTTLLYLGGMYLNDAFDAGFDAQYRRERPIPSGAISAGQVIDEIDDLKHTAVEWLQQGDRRDHD